MIHKKNTSLLLLIILCNTLLATGQHTIYTLSLTIKDITSKKALTGVNLKIGSNSFISDSQGVIRIRRSTYKSFHGVFSMAGYSDLNVQFYPQNTIEKDSIFLTRTTGELQAVTIRSYLRPNEINSIVPAMTLHAKDLNKTKGANLAQILETIPGVNILKTSNTIGKPIVDGLYGNRVLVINNGVKIEGQAWGIEHAPEVDPSNAQQISVTKGADAVRYGAEALGGVIILSPAPLSYNDSALHGELVLNGATNGRGGSSSAEIGSSFNRMPQLAWRIHGSYKRLGNYKTKEYFLENTGMDQKSIGATLGYQGSHYGGQVYFDQYQTALGIFIGSDIGSVADLYARIHSKGPFEEGTFSYKYNAPYQTVKHQLFKVNTYYNTKDGSHFEIKFNLQKDYRKEYDKRRSTRATIPITDLELSTNTLEGSWEKVFAKKWHTTVGVNLRGQSNYNDTITLSNPVIPNYSANSVGIFGIERLTLNKKIELEAGTRIDYQAFNAAGRRFIYLYYDDQGNIIPNADVPYYDGHLTLHGGYHNYGGDRTFQNLSFILGGLWRSDHNLQIRSNLGLAWRAPNAEELYSYGLHQSVHAIEYGDSTLKSEQGFKWINSITKTSSLLDFNVSLYLQYIKNYIYLNPTNKFEQTVTGTYPVFENKQTNAFLKGIDLDAKYHFGQSGELFEYELKASILRASNLTQNKYLPFIPSDRFTNCIQYNIPASEKLTEEYVQLSYLFVLRQNRYTTGSDFLAPPPSYGLFGISAGTRITLKGNRTLDINFSIDNLLNESYRDYMDRFRYYVDEIGRNIQIRAIYKF
ncbi:iron complex outermembrane recepter protein [Arachidicoccus rhizosphaerae]|uniref:Iron complex outermembrane recepter protein n=1 Tax=Arachidicoccus rhizosphaerae TaxID=551991 RepID=A0A1H4AKU8_9BACT|nr:TonB-dependent receptor [Arachidicoccus rhizosphaerae]SEA36566.1 iron complex outermembrane recepter protein [Arachidicoccus rhizosphaerae]